MQVALSGERCKDTHPGDGNELLIALSSKNISLLSNRVESHLEPR